MDVDDVCFLQAWCLDDGPVTGAEKAVLRALNLIEIFWASEICVHQLCGKCEMYDCGDLSGQFPVETKVSYEPHLDIQFVMSCFASNSLPLNTQIPFSCFSSW